MRDIHLISPKKITLDSLLDLIRRQGIDFLADDAEGTYWRIRGEAQYGHEDVFLLSQDVALSFYDDARQAEIYRRIGTPQSLFAFGFWHTKGLFRVLQTIERDINDVQLLIDDERDEFMLLREWLDGLQVNPPESWGGVDNTEPNAGDSRSI